MVSWGENTWIGWPNLICGAVFPYGLAARSGRRQDWGPRMALGLHRFLRLPIRLQIGALDRVADSAVRTRPELDAEQGKTRFDRIHTYKAALERAAAAQGIAPDIRLTVLPDCGHSFSDCVEIGALDRIVLG